MSIRAWTRPLGESFDALMKKSPKKRVTAEALLEKLHSDPAWVAKRQEEERVRQERAAHLRASETPLIAALQAAGVRVDSVWDLVNTSSAYPEAIPILIDHLRKSYPDRVVEGIGRALAVGEARPYWQTLVDEYEATDGTVMPGKKDGLACAVAKTARDLKDVIRLITDPTNGDSRLLLLPALRRSQDPLAVTVLRELAQNPVFKTEIASWGQTRR